MGHEKYKRQKMAEVNFCTQKSAKGEYLLPFMRKGCKMVKE